MRLLLRLFKNSTLTNKKVYLKKPPWHALTATTTSCKPWMILTKGYVGAKVLQGQVYTT